MWFKTIEQSQVESGRARLKSFMKSSTVVFFFCWENFGVLDRWSLIGGCCTWRLECSKSDLVKLKETACP